MKCQCKPECTVEVKTKGRKYARGHNPVSHVMGEERKTAISEARKEFFKRGGVSWWKGREHSEETKAKQREAAKNRTPEHKRKITESYYVSEARQAASEENRLLAVIVNTGTPRSEETKQKISAAIKAARKVKNWEAWNKGKVGVQIGWAKGFTKETHPGLAKISNSLMGHPLNKSRWKCWYPSENDKQICMRSTWEVAFANWMDHCGIEWQYEPQSFHVGPGKWTGLTYTPDFYLPNQNEYVEIKGWYSDANKRKMKRFQELYPDVRLTFFFGPHLNAAKIIQYPVRAVKGAESK